MGGRWWIITRCILRTYRLFDYLLSVASLHLPPETPAVVRSTISQLVHQAQARLAEQVPTLHTGSVHRPSCGLWGTEDGKRKLQVGRYDIIIITTRIVNIILLLLLLLLLPVLLIIILLLLGITQEASRESGTHSLARSLTHSITRRLGGLVVYYDTLLSPAYVW